MKPITERKPKPITKGRPIRLYIEDSETLLLVEKLSGMKAEQFLHDYLSNVRHIVNGYGHEGYRLSALSVLLPHNQETSISDRRVLTYFGKIFSGEFRQNVNDYSGETKVKRIISRGRNKHE